MPTECNICQKPIRPRHQLRCDTECVPAQGYEEIPRDVEFRVKGCTPHEALNRAVNAKTLFLACGHAFCAECIGSWLRDHHGATCPVCRRPFAKCSAALEDQMAEANANQPIGVPGPGADPTTIADANTELLPPNDRNPIGMDRFLVATQTLANAMTMPIATGAVEEMMDGLGETAAPMIATVRDQNPTDAQRGKICSDMMEALMRTVYLPSIVPLTVASDLATFWRNGLCVSRSRRRRAEYLRITWNALMRPRTKINTAFRSFIDPAEAGGVVAGGWSGASSGVVAGVVVAAVSVTCILSSLA